MGTNPPDEKVVVAPPTEAGLNLIDVAIATERTKLTSGDAKFDLNYFFVNMGQEIF